jgi:hypothetical protein
MRNSKSYVHTCRRQWGVCACVKPGNCILRWIFFGGVGKKSKFRKRKYQYQKLKVNTFKIFSTLNTARWPTKTVRRLKCKFVWVVSVPSPFPLGKKFYRYVTGRIKSDETYFYINFKEFLSHCFSHALCIWQILGKHEQKWNKIEAVAELVAVKLALWRRMGEWMCRATFSWPRH